MLGNITKAYLRYGQENKASPLYQYDYGQVLQLLGVDLPEAYEVHFSNSPRGEAKTAIGNGDGVVIPDEYLLTGAPVYAWLYLHTGESDGETEYSITIPVIARAKPTDAEPTPVQQDAITQAIAALNTAVTESAQSAEAAAGSAELAEENAELAAGYAESAQSAAEAAEGAKTAAQTAAGNADTSAQNAAQSASEAATSATEAEAARDTITGMNVTAQTLPAGADATASWADGTLALGIPRGGKGDTGNGIASAVLNSDYTLTLTFTDGTSYTTPSIRGKIGETGNGIASAVLNADYTLTLTFTDGTSYTTPSIRGANGVGVPTGGTTGQVLSKASDTDYDTEWTTVEAGGGTVTDVQVAGQSVVQDGVANVPTGGLNTFGAVSYDNQYGNNGIIISNGAVRTSAATSDQIKTDTNSYKPIVPTTQHLAAFYGFAKAAGDTTQRQSSNAVGTYTENAKSKISEMLNSPVTVAGTTPTITALSGIQYVCGEVSTLDITLPASGIVDVVFQSGSTPTVLTVTPPTGVTLRWANGFDPTVLEANTTYEINVFDGAYAKVTHWNNEGERRTPVVLYDTTFAEDIGSSTPFTTMLSLTDVDGIPLSAFGITTIMITCITPTDPNNTGLWSVYVALNEDSLSLPSPNSKTTFAINPNNINKKYIQLLTDDFAIIWGISSASYAQSNMFMSGDDMTLSKDYHSKYINKIMIGTKYPNGSMWLAGTRLHIIGW